MLTDVSSEMVYPLLPVYLVTTLGASPAILGVIEGIAESFASLLKVFSGYLSDKIKLRKPFAILGYSGSAIGKFLLFVSTGWGMVLVARIVDRFGKGIRTAPRDALIAESVKDGKKGRAYGLHRAMDTFGACLGIIIAYFIINSPRGGLKNIFMLSLIPALIGVAILFLVKEKPPITKEHRQTIKFNWNALDRRLKFFLVFTFIFTLGNSSNQFLLLRAKNTGISLPQMILFYLLFNVIYFLVSYPAGHLSDKIGRKKLLVSGYFFYGMVYLGFALNTSFNGFWVLFGLYGLYMGFTDGIEKALIADIAPGNLKATAIGLHATLVGIGLLPASLLAGVLWDILGPSAPFYFGGFMGITASAGLWFILRGL